MTDATRKGHSGASQSEMDEEHLTGILKQHFYLQCPNCSLLHKTVSSYLTHVKDCKADPSDKKSETKKLTCALCWEEMNVEQWPTHQLDEHYNVAWHVGGEPVNIKNPNLLIQYIDKYKSKYKGLKCRLCGATRASHMGFYAHVLACKKSEEDIDMYKDVCDICGKKYFYFYRNQHMTYHVQQGLKTEKEEMIKKEREKKEIKVNENEEIFLGRGGRRAAQRARNIIQKFKEGNNYNFKCEDCMYGADTNEELKQHICKKGVKNSFSDSDDSCKPEDESESEDSDIESNLSAEENMNGNQTYQDSDESDSAKRAVHKRMSHHGERIPLANMIPRFPKTSTAKSDLIKFGSEFHEHNFVSKNLFPELRSFDRELVPDEILCKYLPPLEESCKVQLVPEEWTTLKRFEANKIPMKGIRPNDNQVLFTGGYIGCISWAPPCKDDSADSPQYLAVVCHRDVDQPRFDVDELSTGPGLIQIWDFGNFSKPAEFVFGIAHDFGYVWAVDWCPSGARDSFPKEVVPDDDKQLGLLCVAFSSGAVYIFSVPYPSVVANKENNKIHKLKPVMELKFTMKSERRPYSAISLSWSKQNGHQVIVVGYSDGTMAYYDLNTESPFLKITYNNKITLYPYHDERLYNSSITGLDTYPSLQKDKLAGALSSSSVTGAVLTAYPGVQPVRQRIISAIGNTHFQPFWPSSIIVGDEANLASAMNEVELWGAGRRFGGGSAAACCWWCGQVAIAPTPLLRICYTHPIYRPKKGERPRETFGAIRMKPLSDRKRKLKNDDFQMKMEPTRYEDAIAKYGLEVRLDKQIIAENDGMSQSYPEKTPERFPLSEVTSMAFCPAAAHHRKLAVATHAGCLLLINVRM